MTKYDKARLLELANDINDAFHDYGMTLPTDEHIYNVEGAIASLIDYIKGV